jgi:hypothetical protein
MSVLSSLLRRTSSVKNIGILFFASHFVLLLMMLFTFPVINHAIGTKAFDLRTFGYSNSEAQTIVHNLNDHATNIYLFPQLTLLDLLYPFLLALFLSSLLFRLFKLTGEKSKVASLLLVVPFLAMTFDYFENVCIVLMITQSVKITETMVILSSTFTVLKGVLTSIAWMAIIVYSIKWARLKMLKKRKNKRSKTRSTG